LSRPPRGESIARRRRSIFAALFAIIRFEGRRLTSAIAVVKRQAAIAG
jgi:hypothetical protein